MFRAIKPFLGDRREPIGNLAKARLEPVLVNISY
jgi:hypothetical protein